MAGTPSSSSIPRPFAARLQPAPREPALADPEWWTWCGATLRAPDGRIHLFASRWPRRLPFFNGYLAASRIVHAVADAPLGPFGEVRDLLGPRGTGYWDGCMTHNPAVIAFSGQYWLYYIGLRYDEPLSDLAAPFDAFRPIYRRIRIGVAHSTVPQGPYTRLDRPVIDVDVAPWPHVVTTNPAPLVTPAGRVRVYYRTPCVTAAGVRNVLAVAEADHPLGPFHPLTDRPLFPEDWHLEDPHVWWNGTQYEALAKDLDGNMAGQVGAVVHLVSDDGLAWQGAEPLTAWRRELRFADGGVLEVGNLERPWVLRGPAGEPEVLYVAASDDPRGFRHATRTWLHAIPLR